MSMTDYDYLKSYLLDFHKLARLYDEYMSAGLKEYELSPNEITVINSISQKSTASKIAKDNEVSKALVSRSIKSLESKGIVSSTISSSDKRESNLALTDLGRTIQSKIRRLNNRFAEKTLNRFDDNKRRTFGMLLRVLCENHGRK